MSLITKITIMKNILFLLSFDKSVHFDVSKLPVELIKYRYPKEYYKIENGKAFPMMGRYADDLVKLWKEIKNKSKS
ncbi:MAG: hypothetical protein K0R36_2534 [Chryseobacterium sp.]|nr:hypothetical protein [Chryseobacterium sp.]